MTKQRGWESLCRNPALKLNRTEVQKFLREVIPKESGGPIRQVRVRVRVRVRVSVGVREPLRL